MENVWTLYNIEINPGGKKEYYIRFDNSLKIIFHLRFMEGTS